MIKKDILLDRILILDPDSSVVLAVRNWNPAKTWPGLNKIGGYVWTSSFDWVQNILDRYQHGSTIEALDEAIIEVAKRRRRG
jgi:hypothetical protein